MNNQLRLKDLDRSSAAIRVSVSGDCLEGLEIYDGDFVDIAVNRFPRLPAYKAKDGYSRHDVCLCYRLFPAQKTDNPPLLLKAYCGVFMGSQEVGTMYKREPGAPFRDISFPAEILGVVYAVYDREMNLRWKCPPDIFPLGLPERDSIRCVGFEPVSCSRKGGAER